MGIDGIIIYLFRAFIFAFPLSLIFAIVRLYRNKRRGYKLDRKRELLVFLFIFYILSLVQITIIREWWGIFHFFELEHSLSSIQLIPVLRTIKEAENGLWSVVYPVVGNIVWFVPLGSLLTFLNPLISIKHIFVISLITSFLIELFQWIFQSGISDIDDVLWNIIGGGLGYVVSKFILKSKSRPYNKIK